MFPKPARSVLGGRRRIVAVAAILLPVALSACGSDGADSSTAAPRPDRASGAEVRLKLIAFKPSALRVNADAAVTWIQSDPGSHTVTSGTVTPGSSGVTVEADGRFASGELTTGERFRFTFDEPGTYPYYCEIHPATMRGAVTVR